MNTFLCVYLGSAVLAIVLTPLVIRLACHLGALDQPGVRTIHERPVPRLGGVAIFLSAMGLIVPVLFLNNVIGEAFRVLHRQVTTLLVTATFIFLMGLLDDLKGLPARIKFLTELLAAGMLCSVGVRIDSVALGDGLVLHLGGWGCLLTLLWITGITNAVNLSDGLDGLAAGISAIACGVIAIFSIYSDDAMMAVFALALLGSLCGFLLFNFNPAKVFMGDCGSLFLGFIIAAASVMCVAKSAALVGLALPALALGIPIFDTLFCMLRRFLERRSLFAPDRSHFHHRLLDMGLHQRHAVLVIYLATLLAAGFGLFMIVSEDLSALVVFGCVLLLLVLLFRGVGAVRLRETLARLQHKHLCSLQEREDRRTFEYLQLRFRQAHDPSQWWQTICEAARRMDFAWVRLRTTRDGRVEETFWRSPHEGPGRSRTVTMTIPLGDGDPEAAQQVEIAIWVKSSIESAGRRGSLFTRLMESSG